MADKLVTDSLLYGLPLGKSTILNSIIEELAKSENKAEIKNKVKSIEDDVLDVFIT
jgi:hypothetical protein